MREKGIVSAAAREDERQFEAALRPQRLADFTGQPKLKENLAIAIEAARLRGEALDHVLLYGPSRSRKDDTRHDHRKRAGDFLSADIRSDPAKEARSDRHPDYSHGTAGFLHRRDSSPDAGHRGDPLLGARGFPCRYRDRPRSRSANAQDAAEALHGSRGNHATRSAGRALASALRTDASA